MKSNVIQVRAIEYLLERERREKKERKEVELEHINLQGGVEIIVLPFDSPILHGCSLCPDCNKEHEGACIVLEVGRWE